MFGEPRQGVWECIGVFTVWAVGFSDPVFCVLLLVIVCVWSKIQVFGSPTGHLRVVEICCPKAQISPKPYLVWCLVPKP